MNLIMQHFAIRFETRTMHPMCDMRHHTEKRGGKETRKPGRRIRAEQLVMIEQTEKKIQVGIYTKPLRMYVVQAN